MLATRECERRNTVPRVAEVIGAAIVLQRMSRLVVLEIEDEWHRLTRVRGVENFAELPGESLRADHLEVRRPGADVAMRKVRRGAAAHHVLIDLTDHRIERHRRVVGEPARADETVLLTRVADEENRAPRMRCAA